MTMYIQREIYLNRLIAKKDNGFIKVITGVYRCGKSFLLFTLYKEYDYYLRKRKSRREKFSA